MASAEEFNMLTKPHQDSSGAAQPAQTKEVAQVNSQYHGEDVMAAIPAIVPTSTAIQTAMLMPNEQFAYNMSQKSAEQKYYPSVSSLQLFYQHTMITGNALMLAQSSNGDAVIS